MKVKILSVLKAKPFGYVSGEALSKNLKVSRTAIWKCINELKREGYSIEASSRKGYRLMDTPDMLCHDELVTGWDGKVLGTDFIVLDSVDSTNNYAKKLASEGCREGTVVLAENQTAGRGRLGREWVSPKGSCIFLSVILKPQIAPSRVPVVTLAAAVSVVKVIEQMTGFRAGIKWPNDVVLGGRKVCGILTEMNSEIDRVNYMVLGVGLNISVQETDFPEDIRSKAASLLTYARNEGLSFQVLKRNDIIKMLLSRLEEFYGYIEAENTLPVIEEWKKYSVTLGSEIKLLWKGKECNGLAMDVTEDGNLLVRFEDGTLHEIVSGEISIRGMLGYV